MISYEIIIAVIVIEIIIIGETTNILTIVEMQKGIWLIIPLSGIGIILIVGGIAETNRTPFDLAESESELVSGFNTEYTSLSFAYFFLGEYGNILGISTVISLLILGGYRIGEYKSSIILGVKVAILVYVII